VTDDDMYKFLCGNGGKPRPVEKLWAKMIERLVADGRARIIGTRVFHYGPLKSLRRTDWLVEAMRPAKKASRTP
jgi:hypothetical protein